MEMPKSTLERITVERKVSFFGPKRGKRVWFVCYDSVPMGTMFDFFEPGFLKAPYPFKDNQIGVDTEDEANALAFRVMEHVNEVVTKRTKIIEENTDLRDASWVHWRL
jgi:hypothetical protein